MVCYNRPHQSKFFKDCIPQMLLGPFVNALFHVFRPFQTSIMERFTKMVSSVNLKLLTILTKRFISEAYMGAEFFSAGG